MTQELTNRTVLVTGGAVRIGRAIVLALVDAGAAVVIHARRSTGAAQELCDILRARGGRAWTVSGALDAPDDVARLFDAAWSAAGRLDGLVNNAGVFSRQPLSTCQAADFEAAWRVNALAPMVLTRLLAERVPAAPTPAAGIVNLLDQRIARPASGCLPYLVSKQALAAFTQSAALELAPRLTVNAVAPGAVLLPVAAAAREPAGAVPLGRQATPEQIGAAVVFLLAHMEITGQILYIDGGQHLQ